MSEELKKLANQAVNLQQKIKSEILKLQEIKETIIHLSSKKTNSFIVNLPSGKVRVVKSRKLKSLILDHNKFSSLDVQLKKKIVKNKIVKIGYKINSKVYEKLLNDGLIDDDLKRLVAEKKRKPFYVYIYLNKEEESSSHKKTEIIELDNTSREDNFEDSVLNYDELNEEIDDVLKDQELLQSILSDDDPADMSDLEKQESGYE